MKVSLLDPGLAGLMGHHFDLDLRLVRELSRRGHEVNVHGFVSPRPALITLAQQFGMALHHTFRVHTWLAPPSAGASIESYRQIALTTAEDLATVPDADVWIWPTMMPYHLMAAISESRPVRQFGGLWSSPRVPLPIGARGWAEAADRLMKTGRPVGVGAYDELVCELYGSFSRGLPIARLPMPHDGVVSSRSPSRLQRIGFFGHQRAARGIEILPQLIAALLGRGFELVVQDSGRTLQAQAGDSRLTVLHYVPDFAAEIARCDLVVWPSLFEPYVHALSGVVSECIATGIPVILPSGCLPADMACRFGCKNFFHDLSVDGILAAVDEVASEYSAVTARSRAAMVAWRAANGTNRLVDWIEARC